MEKITIRLKFSVGNSKNLKASNLEIPIPMSRRRSTWKSFFASNGQKSEDKPIDNITDDTNTEGDEGFEDSPNAGVSREASSPSITSSSSRSSQSSRSSTSSTLSKIKYLFKRNKKQPQNSYEQSTSEENFSVAEDDEALAISERCFTWDEIKVDTVLNRNHRDQLIKMGIDLGNERRRLIAEGRYGAVIRVIWKGREMALKIVSLAYYKHKTVSEAVECLLREYDIFNMVNHPNIVKRISAMNMYDKASKFPYPTHILLFMDIMDGDLDRVIHKCGGRVDGQHTEIWLMQIVTALVYLHENRIAHLDIKPPNILFSHTQPEGEQFKLCDFGMARQVPDGQNEIQLEADIGDDMFRAPEVAQELISDPFCVDIYSLGITAMASLCGTHYSRTELFNDLMNWTEEVEVKYEMERELAELILNMITDEPPMRPNIQEIYNRFGNDIQYTNE